MKRETYEIWVEDERGEAIIHVGTPKEIQAMINKGQIPFDSKRLLVLNNTTLEEAEEEVQKLIMDMENSGDSDYYMS